MSETKNADSAGTQVEKPGRTLLERKKRHPKHSFVIDVMNEIGIDISGETEKQLTKDMLDSYDLVINMAAKRYTPKYLMSTPDYVYWKVRDPRGRSRAVTIKARDEIKQKVSDLLSS